MHARFYHPTEIVIGQIIELSAENKHHAARVLRLKKGDSITLFNGNGGEFSAHIENISKSSTTVLIDNYHAIECESPLLIELAQAICVNEKNGLDHTKSGRAGCDLHTADYHDTQHRALVR